MVRTLRRDLEYPMDVMVVMVPYRSATQATDTEPPGSVDRSIDGWTDGSIESMLYSIKNIDRSWYMQSDGWMRCMSTTGHRMHWDDPAFGGCIASHVRRIRLASTGPCVCLRPRRFYTAHFPYFFRLQRSALAALQELIVKTNKTCIVLSRFSLAKITFDIGQNNDK